MSDERVEDLEPVVEKIETGMQNLGVGGTAAAASPPALPSEAKPSAADPFFSGRRHFLELDGLRGLAILLVLLCHYLYWLIEPASDIYRKVALAFLGKAGAWGVILFFVLSGFLITGILFDAKGQDNYFKNFYARRFLRIFPLYYGFLAVMLIALIAIRAASPQFFSNSLTAERLWRYQPWLWTYTANIWMFVWNRGMVVIGHFWSLSVEEQFYLFWPVLIFFLPTRRSMVYACWTVISASIALGVGLQLLGYSYGRLMHFTPIRMDALAAGGLIALLLRDPGWHRRLAALGTWLLAGGLGLWILSDALQNILRRGFHVASTSHGLPQVLAYNLDPNFRAAVDVLIFVSLLLLAIFPFKLAGLPGKLFQMPWLRWLGRYSYGIYVYHFPLWVFCVMFLQTRGWFAACRHNFILGCILVGANAVVALSVAYASYHLYEKHFLKLKKYFPEKTAPAGTAGI